jgi:hypothetical protein
LVIVGCWGCAGDLENPDRFDFLLDGGATAQGGRGGTGSSGTGGAGGSGAGGSGSSIPPISPCLKTLFEARCGTVACHAASSTFLDLMSPNVEQRLVGKTSTTDECKDDGVYVSSDGGDSLLLKKLEEQPPCGSKMPLVGGDLTDADITCVEDWVKSVSDANGGGS